MDERALGGPQIDPAGGVQPLQRFADGLAADAEMVGELGLDEVLARLEGAVDDQVGQSVVDGLTQRSGPGDRAAGCHGGRVGHGTLPLVGLLSRSPWLRDTDCSMQ